jgi:hypothetical protein
VAWRGGSRWARPKKMARLLRTLVADPVVAARALPGEFRQWSQQRYGSGKFHQNLQAEVDEAWNEHLHGLLGAVWPCPQGQHFDQLMADIVAQLEARGLGSGRYTYGYYSDAESSLCRAVWCTVLHTRPEVVIETGVAHGVTSRVVLEALRQNELGHLWSVDLPFPFDHRLHAETGAAVTEACRPLWSYLEGTSRQRLPPLVADVGHVETFIHDSLHTARNTMFEMEEAAAAMPAGGVMLIDDIGTHDGFAAFARRHPGYQTIICPSADKIGIFGIAIKGASA